MSEEPQPSSLRQLLIYTLPVAIPLAFGKLKDLIFDEECLDDDFDE